jgi:hypothetical protein
MIDGPLPPAAATGFPSEATGMPSRVVRSQIEGLEDLIEGGIEKPEEAIMTAAVTRNGTRDKTA